MLTVVREWVSAYTLNATPGADRYNDLWDVVVQQAIQADGSTMWAVRWMGRCLSRAGSWDIEPSPSSRVGAAGWLERFRFDDLDSALAAARIAAPEVSVNGRKAKEVTPR